MNQDDAQQFARQWASAWNARDVEGVLAHFSDDVVFSSPLAAAMRASDGHVRGKKALRQYWLAGLEQHPNFRVELIDVYLGIDTVVINYGNQVGDVVNEVLRFDGALVVEGHATHLTRRAWEASAYAE